MEPTSVFISSGDPSGDNACHHLITSLKLLKPDLQFFGLGGPKMKSLGQAQLADHRDLAVLGFWEVARRLFFFRRLMRKCVSEIRRIRPSVIVLVDYPGFNLRLAKKIKDLGIPIVYYISPQIWAWKKGRIKEIRELIDLMLLILPFEESLYQEHRVNHRMVGHYLLEDIPDDYLGSAVPGNRRIGILPGSRPQEIERMLPEMLEAFKRLTKMHKVSGVVAGIRGTYDYERVIEQSGADKLSVTYDDSRRVVCESQLVLTASGTATLECGLIGRPMVVVYKTGWITYQIARRLVTLDNIALVNLVLGEKVVPELIQREARAERMAQALARYLDDPTYLAATVKQLGRLSECLGGKGASMRAAQAIAEYL